MITWLQLPKTSGYGFSSVRGLRRAEIIRVDIGQWIIRIFIGGLRIRGVIPETAMSVELAKEKASKWLLQP